MDLCWWVASRCMARLVGAGEALFDLGHLLLSSNLPLCLPFQQRCLVFTGWFCFSVSETCRLLLFLEMPPLLFESKVTRNLGGTRSLWSLVGPRPWEAPTSGHQVFSARQIQTSHRPSGIGGTQVTPGGCPKGVGWPPPNILRILSSWPQVFLIP